MSTDVSSVFSRDWQWLKYVLAGMGVPVALAVGLFQLKPSREELLRRQVEEAFGLPRRLMEAEDRIDRIAESKHSITEADWESNLRAYRTGNNSAKALCLATLAFLKSNNPHPSESVALAKEFIRSSPIEDWHPAIRVLKAENDVSWTMYNQQGLECMNPATRQSYMFFDVNVLKLGGPNSDRKGRP